MCVNRLLETLHLRLIKHNTGENTSTKITSKSLESKYDSAYLKSVSNQEGRPSYYFVREHTIRGGDTNKAIVAAY